LENEIRLIYIWEDAWIPTSPTRKIYTPRGGIVLDKGRID
jgi:hypothetical protein